ncbi:MAG TPA: cytochrome c biogenesis heme-transporting ATPase CcmA [Casimicrobiaceae bacterium]|nr:cytochrome c biogenesis heme-transporting ATPase CcmA [Casimicrobiaceae bacterium]
MTSCADGVAAEGLAARRGYATLFANLQFSVSTGCVLIVTGPNGSGKTTLLRIVAGLTAPAEGEIRWQGQAMRPFDARMREAVAFNGHLPALKDELSAEENLRAWIALDDRSPANDAVGDALDAVALARQRRLPVRVLSQGQRRRIGLARLRLVTRPLWVLDEPLTALDADGVDALGALLDAHLAGGGLCIAASHQALPIASERVRSLALSAP